MLGLCSHELDRAEEAVVDLQIALEAADVTDEQVTAHRFELGRACEALGEIERAREAYEAVAAVDPSFCEVEARLAALEDEKPEPESPTRASSRSPISSMRKTRLHEAGEDTASEPVEAEYESFDDLIAEANEALVEDDEDDDRLRRAERDGARHAPEPEAPAAPSRSRSRRAAAEARRSPSCEEADVEHLHHFKLAEDPFRNEPLLRYLFESRAAAGGAAAHGSGRPSGQGAVRLIGDVGSGKTMAVRQLLENLEEEVFEASMMVVLNGGRRRRPGC